MVRVFNTGTKELLQLGGTKEDPTYVLREQKDLISDYIIGTGKWEIDLINFAKGFIKEDSNVLDIGANIGTWSVELSSAAPKGRVFSFEPQLETFKNLTSNLFFNNCKNVTAFQCALGTTEESGQFLSMNEDLGNNGGTSINSDSKVDPKAAGSVEVKCLDDFIDRIPKIDFAKIDVEGYEIHVLCGGTKLLSRDRPVIFFEVYWSHTEEKKKELFKWFELMNYEVNHYKEYDYYAVPRDAPSEETVQLAKGIVQDALNKESGILKAATSSGVVKKKNLTWLWVLIAVLGVLAIVGASVLVWRMKGKGMFKMSKKTKPTTVNQTPSLY